MTIDNALIIFTKQLVKRGIDSARLDILILLEDTTGLTRAHLLAHPERHLSPDEERSLTQAVRRRADHEPLAYIRGKAQFYGRSFTVTSDTLVPRPETETLVTLVLMVAKTMAQPAIVDVGTGTGCIAITCGLELPDAKMYASDIDERALAVARSNGQALGAEISFQRQDMLNGDDKSYDIIAANLPYVPAAYPINHAAKHEPALALFAGDDGLDLYRTFWEQISQRTTHPSYIITESLQQQHQALEDIAQDAGYSLQKKEGLIQLFSRQVPSLAS